MQHSRFCTLIGQHAHTGVAFEKEKIVGHRDKYSKAPVVNKLRVPELSQGGKE
jgi:hypothetical protein